MLAEDFKEKQNSPFGQEPVGIGTDCIIIKMAISEEEGYNGDGRGAGHAGWWNGQPYRRTLRDALYYLAKYKNMLENSRCLDTLRRQYVEH